jgi:hypothetical protein
MPFLLLMYLKAVSIRISTRIIRDYSTFMLNHNFKVSLAARCVSAANAICKDIDILTRIIFC